jgi:DNA-directed RNA polymerase subunit K/omega
MKSKILSRGTEIDTEQCVVQVGGNRFELVLIAAIRSRELARQHKRSENKEHIYPNVLALLEIQNKKIDREYLKRIS